MRKRMIDPEIWDSATAKNWTPDDFTVMVGAISNADDEGRGRVSVLMHSLSGMVPTKKFKKSLAKLSDSIVIYHQIYYFLPNFLKYQTLSHPKKSKFPEPNLAELNDLDNNSSIPIPSEFHPNSILREEKRREVNLKELEEKGNGTKNPGGGSSIQPNFEDKEQVLNQILYLFKTYCDNSTPEQEAELLPVLLSVYDKREGMTPDICYPLVVESFIIMRQKKKTNTDYLLGIIENKLTAKYCSIQESKTNANQSESDRIRAETKHKEYVEEQKIIAENKKKVLELKEFYDNNKNLFTREEKLEIKKWCEYGHIIKLEAIISPKMQDISL